MPIRQCLDLRCFVFSVHLSLWTPLISRGNWARLVFFQLFRRWSSVRIWLFFSNFYSHLLRKILMSLISLIIAAHFHLLLHLFYFFLSLIFPLTKFSLLVMRKGIWRRWSTYIARNRGLFDEWSTLISLHFSLTFIHSQSLHSRLMKWWKDHPWQQLKLVQWAHLLSKAWIVRHAAWEMKLRILGRLGHWAAVPWASRD